MNDGLQPLTLRDRALMRLRAMLGDPETVAAGEVWTVRTDASTSADFAVTLNSPDVVDSAEVLITLGSARVYSLQARSEEELSNGLELVRQILRG